jgi:hypothetical protein
MHTSSLVVTIIVSAKDSRRMERHARLPQSCMSGMGFLTLVHSLLWHFLFVSSKQAHAVRERADPLVTEEEWAEKSSQITAEHKEAGARDHLLAGWTQCSAARNTG